MPSHTKAERAKRPNRKIKKSRNEDTSRGQAIDRAVKNIKKRKRRR